VRDPPSLARACAGVEWVINCAAVVRVGRRRYAYHKAVNERGAGNVALAAKVAGARLVHVSTVDALGYGTRDHPADELRPPDKEVWVPYVVTKRQGDRRILAELDSGLDAVIVHPAYILGPWDWKPSSGRILLQIARGRALAAPPGGNDFCHVEDVAAGVLAAAEKGVIGERYILGGEALSYREAFELFARVTGGRPPRFDASARLVKLAGLAGDVVGLVRRREPDVNSATALLSCLPHHFTDRKARERLGYTSRPAEEAARDAWAWLRAHGYAK
jgi:dihydroflavonol-4-reductase